MRRTALLLATTILTSAVIASSACGGGSKDDPSADGESNQPIELTAYDFSFVPNDLEAALGSLQLKVTSKSDEPHTFTIDALELDVMLDPRVEAKFTVTLMDPGDLAFYCRFQVAKGMRGAIIISSSEDGETPANSPGDDGSNDGY
jgi:plastocyanin